MFLLEGEGLKSPSATRDAFQMLLHVGLNCIDLQYRCLSIIRKNLIELKISVIMITGGSPSSEVGKRVELLNPDGTHMCELESLPDERTEHTQSGLITCGGHFTQDSCLIFSFSSRTWQSHGSTLMQPRYGHSSYRRKNTTLLIGGDESLNTTEMISMDGTQRPSIKLNHFTR